MDEKLQRRLIQLSAAISEFYEPEEVLQWFFSAQPLLHNRRPIDMIDNDTDWLSVSSRIAALLDGAFI